MSQTRSLVEACLTRSLLTALSITVCLTCSAFAQSEREGWHDEPMPEGIEKGTAKGEYVWQKDGSVMVYVPPGKFPMGSDTDYKDEKPVHEVHLDGYYIDKYEVTWRQWRLSGLGLPKDINGAPIGEFKPVWGRGDELPVTYIDWYDANNYAEWAGKRLPTEAEWEKAARGTDGREFPWGDEEPTFDHAIWKDHPIGKEGPAPVDCCAAGASPYGVFNMAGNAFEWCADVYDSKYYASSPSTNPINEKPGQHYVLRGGSFVLEIEDLRTALRNRQWPQEGQDYVGFRLVLSQQAAYQKETGSKD